jgi:presqualene diphosphate synthase
MSRRHSSFYWAMRLMPAERRQAMFAVYTYCRALDDIADGPSAPTEKLATLAGWRAGLAALEAGRPAGIAEIAALDEPRRRFGLETEPLLALVEGMEMDARGAMVAPAAAELERYTYCVAGAVGLLAIRIFGAPAARGFALALGDALQLTNILRDLAEDAARGRLYLPRELLERAGIEHAEPRSVIADPRVATACALLAEQAEARFRDAAAALPADPAPLRPALVMGAVYRRLLDRLVRRGFARERLPERVRVPEHQRLWIAFRHLGPPATWPTFTS